MSEFKFIPLKCPNCGGKLEISNDMERFSCGYCGTDLIAERKGGTIALKPITDAIHRVQVGTDKTAAELAIRRLKDEIAEMLARQAERRQQFEDYVDEERAAYDEAMSKRAQLTPFLVLSVVVFMVAYGITQSTGTAFAIGIVCLFVCRGLQGWMWHQKEMDVKARIDDASADMLDELAAIDQQIATVQPRIEDMKRMANL